MPGGITEAAPGEQKFLRCDRAGPLASLAVPVEPRRFAQGPRTKPNVPAHRRRATDAQHGTRAFSRRSVHPTCWALGISFQSLRTCRGPFPAVWVLSDASVISISRSGLNNRSSSDAFSFKVPSSSNLRRFQYRALIKANSALVSRPDFLSRVYSRAHSKNRTVACRTSCRGTFGCSRSAISSIRAVRAVGRSPFR